MGFVLAKAAVEEPQLWSGTSMQGLEEQDPPPPNTTPPLGGAPRKIWVPGDDGC